MLEIDIDGALGICKKLSASIVRRQDAPVVYEHVASIYALAPEYIKRVGFLLDGPIKTLSQAAMVFSLMNPDIHTTVPGVKNRTETEEIASCADLGPISASHLDRLRELYQRGFRD